jgi:hypothetical protein
MLINCTIVLRVFLDFTRDISSILPVFVKFCVLTLVMYEIAISNANRMYTKSVVEQRTVVYIE